MSESSRPPAVVREIHHYHRKGPDPGLAVVLELGPGIFLQTFGIGNIYAGNIVWGIVLMLSYWVAAAVNLLLLSVGIGFITWPLTFIGFAVIGTVTAKRAAVRRGRA